MELNVWLLANKKRIRNHCLFSHFLFLLLCLAPLWIVNEEYFHLIPNTENNDLIMVCSRWRKSTKASTKSAFGFSFLYILFNLVIDRTKVIKWYFFFLHLSVCLLLLLVVGSFFFSLFWLNVSFSVKNMTDIFRCFFFLCMKYEMCDDLNIFVYC